MLFTNLNGFKWVQDDGTMLIFMVEMSTKKRKKAGHKKKKIARVRSPAARLIIVIVKEIVFSTVTLTRGPSFLGATFVFG